MASSAWLSNQRNGVILGIVKLLAELAPQAHKDFRLNKWHWEYNFGTAADGKGDAEKE
jgi:hypothetical protein